MELKILQIERVKVRERACCMCPALSVKFESNICDDETEFAGRKVGRCNFVNKYKSPSGDVFIVRKSEIDGLYWIFCIEKESNLAKRCDNIMPRDLYHLMQETLNEMAIENDWEVYVGDIGTH